MECNRRFSAVGGPRAFELVAALVERWPQVQSGIVYIGDERAGALMRRCGRTAHRAKYDLAAAGLIVLHGAGPKYCSCARCGGPKAGGTIYNSRNEAVAAATGYELDPTLISNPSGRAAPSTRSNAARHRSPAEQRLVDQGRAKLAAALDNLRARPGP
jgi:hypothetical protein